MTAYTHLVRKGESMIQFCQGDVMIQKVASKPKTKVLPLHNGAIVLAFGEVTGHSHKIDNPAGCALLEPLERTADDEILNVRFLEIMESSGVDIVHEEHDTIHLDPGIYRISLQREYQPRALPRRVAD